MERTILVSGKTLLDTADFEVHCMNTSGAKSTIPPSLEGLTLDELEKQTILRSLEAHGGNYRMSLRHWESVVPHCTGD